MKTIFFTLLLCFTTTCKAGWNDWDESTKILFVTSSIAITTDYMLTRDYAKNKHLYSNAYETNPLIGKYPSVATIDLFMIVALVSNYFITDYLPPAYKNIYLGLKTVAHGTAAINNYSIGFRIRF